jgi:dihydrofolate reductase
MTAARLIDQVVMNVVPVVFGAGRPFFGAIEPGDTPSLLRTPLSGSRTTG